MSDLCVGKSQAISSKMDNVDVTTLRSPLFTYLITKNIFSFLTYQQLKSARFVCKFWSEVGFPIIRSKSLVTINNSSSLAEHIKCIESLVYDIGDDDNLNNVEINQDRDLGPSAFPNYKIKLPDSEWEGLVLFQHFWECYKCNIKDLSLEMPPNFGRRIIKSLLNDPRLELKRLKIKILHFFVDRDIENQKEDLNSNQNNFFCDSKGNIIANKNLISFYYSVFAFDNTDFTFPINWNQFIQQFSNLQEVEFVGISESQLNEILAAIATHRENNKNSLKIRSFSILNEEISPESPRNNNLFKLGELALPLKCLALEIGPEIDFMILEALLQKCGQTLQKLHLRRYPFEHNRFTFHPSISLCNLTHLDISDKFVHDLNFILNSSQQSFPKLKSLKISIRDYRHLNDTDIISNTRINIHTQPNEVLKELTIEPLVTMDCVRKLVKLFPELRYLKLRVDDVMARIIFSGLKKLTEIYLTAIIYIDNYNMNRCTLTDEGITGIPFEILKTGQVEVATDRILPFIGELKDLEKITIESWHDYGKGITDFSVCYGLMELKNLQSIHLERTLISAQGFALLASLPNVSNISAH